MRRFSICLSFLLLIPACSATTAGAQERPAASFAPLEQWRRWKSSVGAGGCDLLGRMESQGFVRYASGDCAGTRPATEGACRSGGGNDLRESRRHCKKILCGDGAGLGASG